MRQKGYQHPTIFILGVILLAGLLNACGARPAQVQVETPAPEATATAFVSPTAKDTATPQAAATRRPTSTGQATATIAPKVITAVAEVCPDPELEAYLAKVLPLGDQHVLDSKKAEKMSELSQAEMESYRQRAVERLEELKRVSAPECLKGGQESFVKGFTLLIETWDLGLKGDFENSRLKLLDAYNGIVEAVGWMMVGTNE